MLTTWKSKKQTKCMACESIYWIIISDDIKKHYKNCSSILDFTQHNQKEKIIHHKIPVKPWEIFGTDMFTLHRENYLSIVYYHSNFPVIKKMEDLSADSIILTCKIIFFRIWFTKVNNVRFRW